MVDEKWYEFMKSNPKEWLAQEKANKWYHLGKQFLDVFMLGIFCVLIFLLAWKKLIPSDATSALVGLTVGYVLPKFRKKAIND